MARCGPARHRPGAAASRRDGVSRRTSVCLTATGRLAPTAGASVKRVDHLRRCADVPPRRGRARRTTRRGPRGPAGPSRSAAPHRGAGGDAVAAGDRPVEPVGRAGAQGDQRTTRTAHRHGDRGGGEQLRNPPDVRPVHGGQQHPGALRLDAVGTAPVPLGPRSSAANRGTPSWSSSWAASSTSPPRRSRAPGSRPGSTSATAPASTRPAPCAAPSAMNRGTTRRLA